MLLTYYALIYALWIFYFSEDKGRPHSLQIKSHNQKFGTPPIDIMDLLPGATFCITRRKLGMTLAEYFEGIPQMYISLAA